MYDAVITFNFTTSPHHSSRSVRTPDYNVANKLTSIVFVHINCNLLDFDFRTNSYLLAWPCMHLLIGNCCLSTGYPRRTFLESPCKYVTTEHKALLRVDYMGTLWL